MSSYEMKPVIRWPRCLLCDRVLHLRRWFGKRKKYVECACSVTYAKAAILDADPVIWEKKRNDKTFELRLATSGRVYLSGMGGLGSRRVVV
jgi:hypothetical protein